MNSNYDFLMPTRVVSGNGTLSRVGDLAAPLGERPFVVAGRASARSNGSLSRVLSALGFAKLYEGVDENPTDAAVDDAAAACREGRCDSIVAIGGGSVIDLAKAVAVLATNPGKASDYYGADRFAESPLPLIAIPTTAGTGTEVTPYSVLVDVAANDKRTIGGTALFPRVAILDPEITVTMPRSVTVHSGLDVLSQGIEGILSTSATPLTDVLGLETIRLVMEWLPRAADQPGDREARGWMLHAAMLSGIVVAQTGTTLVHGMGYLYTTECGVAHGLANALLLPPLLEYDAPHVPEKMQAIAAALGEPCGPTAAGGVAALQVRQFVEGLGFSPAASDHGVRKEQLAEFAKRIDGNETRFKKQLGRPAEAEILTFYEASFRGGTLKG